MSPRIVEFRVELNDSEVENRETILEYLRRGTLIRISTARSPDPLESDSGRTYSIGWMSDGELIWGLHLLELLEDYPTLRVPSEIVEATQTRLLPVPLKPDQLDDIIRFLSE